MNKTYPSSAFFPVSKQKNSMADPQSGTVQKSPAPQARSVTWINLTLNTVT